MSYLWAPPITLVETIAIICQEKNNSISNLGASAFFQIYVESQIEAPCSGKKMMEKFWKISLLKNIKSVALVICQCMHLLLTPGALSWMIEVQCKPLR